MPSITSRTLLRALTRPGQHDRRGLRHAAALATAALAAARPAASAADPPADAAAARTPAPAAAAR